MDFYDLLGVRATATPAEIRRAYQRRARALHPALNPGDPVAAQRYQAVTQAFEVLKDAKRRAQYDRGESAPAPAPDVPEVRFEGFDFSEVRVGGGGFRDIFEGVLTREDTGAARGEDLEQVTSVRFEECFTGAERRLHIERHDRCLGCGGMGVAAAPGDSCPACRGTGQVRASRGHMIFTRRCRECGGRGQKSRVCSWCAGEGRTARGEWLEVHVPAGVGHGSRVRLPGLGNAGRRGGPPGDFVLTVEVEPHPLFRREDDDLHCEVPVTMMEAAMGAHVEVPTPEGAVNVEVPAGTQHGQRFRLRKRGLPRLGGQGRGDLWAEVKVVVPTVTDDESRAFLREVERRHPLSPRTTTPAVGRRS